MIMIMIIFILCLLFSICEAGSLIGGATWRININTNINITKYIIITKH